MNKWSEQTIDQNPNYTTNIYRANYDEYLQIAELVTDTSPQDFPSLRGNLRIWLAGGGRVRACRLLGGLAAQMTPFVCCCGRFLEGG
jgi:hypothetical protein